MNERQKLSRRTGAAGVRSAEDVRQRRYFIFTENECVLNYMHRLCTLGWLVVGVRVISCTHTIMYPTISLHYSYITVRCIYSYYLTIVHMEGTGGYLNTTCLNPFGCCQAYRGLKNVIGHVPFCLDMSAISACEFNTTCPVPLVQYPYQASCIAAAQLRWWLSSRRSAPG